MQDEKINLLEIQNQLAFKKKDTDPDPEESRVFRVSAPLNSNVGSILESKRSSGNIFSKVSGSA
jgi:hypothetical protein